MNKFLLMTVSFLCAVALFAADAVAVDLILYSRSPMGGR